MEREFKCRAVVNFETALKIYYTYPEIGNKQIRELFGSIGYGSINRYKKAVQKEQARQGVKTLQQYTINTDVAYQVWGIDVNDYEKRLAKLTRLKKLGVV